MSAFPAPSWFSHYESKLSRRASAQLLEALATSPDDCLMLQHLFLMMPAIALGPKVDSPRDHADSHKWAARICDNAGAERPLSHGLALHKHPLFTNALRPADWVKYGAVGAEDPHYFRQPSARVILGDTYYLTYEFDEASIPFFEQQLAWARIGSAGNNKLDCRLGGLYRRLHQTYADFEGLSFVYSGNKSCHIHLAFTPSLMLRMSPSLATENPRPFLISLWWEIKDLVIEELQPTDDGKPVKADDHLRLPEQFRRMPFGVRVVGDKHLFGVPAGEKIPQCVLWEHYVTKASAADRLLFNPPSFVERTGRAMAPQMDAARAQRIAERRATLPRTVPTAETNHFLERMRAEHFRPGTWPQPSHFEFDGRTNVWTVKFFNYAEDRQPASILREDFESVMIVGGNPHDLKTGAHRLPKTLAEMMADWRYEMYHTVEQSILVDDSPDDDFEPITTEVIELGEGHVVGMTALEQRFAKTAESPLTVPEAIHRFLRSALAAFTLLWLTTPEGLGKTTSLFKLLIERLDAERDRWRRRPQPAMFAYINYLGAKAKCAEFNRARPPGCHYKGLVIYSFTRFYKMALHALKMSPAERITTRYAEDHGYASVFAAVEAEQPEILAWMAQERDRMYAALDHCDPIFFTVHAVAEEWVDENYTRQIWGENFWPNHQNDVPAKDRRHGAIDSTRLSHLIHDEISDEQLLYAYRAEIIEWVRAMVLSDPAAWDPINLALDKTRAAFDAYEALVPCPVIDGKRAKITVEDARHIFRLGTEQWEEQVLTDEGAYQDNWGEKALYRTPVIAAHRWMTKPKTWWRGRRGKSVANTVIVLTTEMIPTEVIRRVGEFRVFTLETPLIAADTVDCFLERSTRAKNMVETINRHLDLLKIDGSRELLVVSDSLDGKIAGAESHKAARGSNVYIGKDVLQTMPFMAPEKHERMLVLNAFTGRTDCVAMQHIDIFNQTAGRNMGFRKSNNARHYLLVNPRLYEFLVETRGWRFTRYNVLVHVSRDRRVSLRKK